MGDHSPEKFIGCECGMSKLMAFTERINEKVLGKVNDTQELVMVSDFARETNENIFKRCLQDRIADITSWRWVLEDLTKRLDDSMLGLKHELKATNVIIKRLDTEIAESKKSKPGVLCPQWDSVERTLKEEIKFFIEQNKTFRDLGKVIHEQIDLVQHVKNKIKGDVLIKDETIAIEENMANIHLSNLGGKNYKKKKSKATTTLDQWENHCRALKEEGLRTLSDCLLAVQQVRGSRLQLTISAQACSNKVDAALKRRLHINQGKLQELMWQKQEANKDLDALKEEQKNTEQSIVKNMDQIKVIEARLADRSKRPPGEHIQDEVDRRLKDELVRVKKFIQDSKLNLEEIRALQNNVTDTITKIDFYIMDLNEVLRLDEERVAYRSGNEPPPPKPTISMSSMTENINTTSEGTHNAQQIDDQLQTIKEEDEIHDEDGENKDDADDEEVDDYPFDY